MPVAKYRVDCAGQKDKSLTRAAGPIPRWQLPRNSREPTNELRHPSSFGQPRGRSFLALQGLTTKASCSVLSFFNLVFSTL